MQPGFMQWTAIYQDEFRLLDGRAVFASYRQTLGDYRREIQEKANYIDMGEQMGRNHHLSAQFHSRRGRNSFQALRSESVVAESFHRVNPARMTRGHEAGNHRSGDQH